MRRAYSAHASSAQPGSLAATATTLSLGTHRFLFQLHFLVAPDFLEVVEAAHRRMHDVHDDVAEVDQQPLAALLSFDAVHPAAGFLHLVAHPVGHRPHLGVRSAAGDDHALEHGGHPGGVEDLDVVALHVLERLDHQALLDADV